MTPTKKCFFVLFIVLCIAKNLHAQNRIHFNNQDLFLSGANVAWFNFADDIGPNQTNFSGFTEMFQQVHDNGGNAMRLWLHTNGANTPEFDEEGMVIGPGEDAIEDLEQILDIAFGNEIGLILCLWSFDMLRISFGEEITNRAELMLTNNVYTNAYINNSLIPMVDSLKDHPGIIAWEIFNEPEGMSNEHGWDFTEHVPMRDIQRFINYCAGAIHRTDPDAKVTNGAWSFIAQTDVGSGNYNYYTDSRLFSAGGDGDGYLDFYTVHYYSWAGTALSPFHHPYSYWELDKPLVVAEYFMEDAYGVPYDSLFSGLYDNGYAGSLSWQWNGSEGTEENRTRMLTGMQYLFEHHQGDVDFVLSTKSSEILPTHFSLEQNYPNPFNPRTTIRYQLSKHTNVKLEIFDVTGRQVAILVNQKQAPGYYSVSFNAANLASGVYLYRLEASDQFADVKRMVILK